MLNEHNITVARPLGSKGSYIPPPLAQKPPTSRPVKSDREPTPLDSDTPISNSSRLVVGDCEVVPLSTARRIERAMNKAISDRNHYRNMVKDMLV